MSEVPANFLRAQHEPAGNPHNCLEVVITSIVADKKALGTAANPVSLEKLVALSRIEILNGLQDWLFVGEPVQIVHDNPYLPCFGLSRRPEPFIVPPTCR